MKSDRQALEEAIELIDNPEHWTGGKYAVDQWGQEVDVWDEQAYAWCAMGALRRVCQNGEQTDRITQAIIGMPFFSPLVRFNDTHLHGDVISLMKQGLDKL